MARNARAVLLTLITAQGRSAEGLKCSSYVRPLVRGSTSAVMRLRSHGLSQAAWGTAYDGAARSLAPRGPEQLRLDRLPSVASAFPRMHPTLPRLRESIQAANGRIG